MRKFITRSTVVLIIFMPWIFLFLGYLTLNYGEKEIALVPFLEQPFPLGVLIALVVWIIAVIMKMIVNDSHFPEKHFKRLTPQIAVNEYEIVKGSLYIVLPALAILLTYIYLNGIPETPAAYFTLVIWWPTAGILSFFLIWTMVSYRMPSDFWFYASKGYLVKSNEAFSEHSTIQHFHSSLKCYDSYLKRLVKMKLSEKDKIATEFLLLPFKDKKELIDAWLQSTIIGPMEPLTIFASKLMIRKDGMLKHESISQKMKDNAMIPIATTITVAIISQILRSNGGG